ncbi:thiosulfate/3-mercaptopyruvate sulfurtransferase [Roseovarius nanhaiticus]|uniref:Thiosulfate/3-mercaptopyruvate sulfurtransferase n=1 Tax=Roseovarius nanhaiticus TaxID=573024 RepID=A0A1N7HG21_9RHOB|nr:rhodanese-like domain-containing protein [Roseovarius nanhaiticus]SEK96509.1 thiosulfate/3-mercaptopyruvate sulfurtransferase [Roseovarius nanhaiticus]SIS23847.1 thiosulfate/3-mercaptopyruvate sulfurtransferase [Roseovarius nanhaiticus]
MRHLLPAAALALASIAAPAFAQNMFGPLITPDALETRLESDAPLILDIRGDAYAEGHIPGAVSAPYGDFRGPKENPGQVIPEDKLEAMLQSLGVTYERPIAIVHEGDSDTDFGAAARVYWTLKSSGLTQLAIVNGGMQAWEAEKRPLMTGSLRPEPSDIDITWTDKWLATTDEVANVVTGGQDAQLVDARPLDFFEGRSAHDAAARPGTLPGATNVTHSNFFTEGGRIVDAQEASTIAERLGLRSDRPVVSFCNTGHWAATDWFAMSELAGMDNVKLYAESMAGYSQTDNEMANVPGLFRNLWNQVMGY